MWLDELGEKSYFKYAGLGLEIAVALSAPILGGYWADTKLNTAPYFLLAGIIIGLSLLIGMFVRLTKDVNSKSKEN
jgi:F0F1-type ATP synthase assembly protein I